VGRLALAVQFVAFRAYFLYSFHLGLPSYANRTYCNPICGPEFGVQVRMTNSQSTGGVRLTNAAYSFTLR
jgi:hypothetical protein